MNDEIRKIASNIAELWILGKPPDLTTPHGDVRDLTQSIVEEFTPLIEDLAAKLEATKKDTERLDELDRLLPLVMPGIDGQRKFSNHHADVAQMPEFYWRSITCRVLESTIQCSGQWFLATTIREAVDKIIDAARQAEEGNNA